MLKCIPVASLPPRQIPQQLFKHIFFLSSGCTFAVSNAAPFQRVTLLLPCLQPTDDIVLMAQALEKIFLQKVAQMPQEEVELLPPAPKGKGRKPSSGTQSAGEGGRGARLPEPTRAAPPYAVDGGRGGSSAVWPAGCLPWRLPCWDPRLLPAGPGSEAAPSGATLLLCPRQGPCLPSAQCVLCEWSGSGGGLGLALGARGQPSLPWEPRTKMCPHGELPRRGPSSGEVGRWLVTQPEGPGLSPGLRPPRL